MKGFKMTDDNFEKKQDRILSASACVAGVALAFAAFVLLGCGASPAEQAQARQGLICFADTLGNIRSDTVGNIARAIGETQLADAACAAAQPPLPLPPVPIGAPAPKS